MTALVSDATRHQLDAMQLSHPHWKLLLALWEQVFQEDARGAWSTTSVSLDPERSSSAPLLSGGAVCVSSVAVNNWLRRLLIQITKEHDRGVALNDELANRLDALGLLEAAITQDEQLIALLAMQAGVEPAPLDAASRMLAAPALFAIGRQLAPTMTANWAEASCPICGARPSIAELRGID